MRRMQAHGFHHARLGHLLHVIIIIRGVERAEFFELFQFTDNFVQLLRRVLLFQRIPNLFHHRVVEVQIVQNT